MHVRKEHPHEKAGLPRGVIPDVTVEGRLIILLLVALLPLRGAVG